jgi:hypothetical protein
MQFFGKVKALYETVLQEKYIMFCLENIRFLSDILKLVLLTGLLSFQKCNTSYNGVEFGQGVAEPL